jgi:K+-sensing histidine kinase KdpD
MAKVFWRRPATEHDVHWIEANAHVDWTQFDRWDREKYFVSSPSGNGRDVHHKDPFMSGAMEDVVLSFAGFFKEVMKHAAVLEEEIGKRALEQFHLGRIQNSCKYGVNLIYRLMVLHGKMPVKVERFDLNDILRGIDPFISQIKRDEVLFEIDMADDDLPISGDSQLLKQLVAELISNASDALLAGGTITLATRKAKMPMYSPDRADGNNVECALLSIVDTGKGIDDEIGAKIFRPFFTTKPTGTAVGLGLPIVNHVVRVHKGNIKIMSRKGVGTSVRIYLPVLENYTSIRETDRQGNPGKKHNRGKTIVEHQKKP